VAPGLAQEELQRVGRRLDRLWERRRLRLLLLVDVDQLEAARLELALERLDVERVELVRLEELRQFGSANRSGGLGRIEEWPELIADKENVDDVYLHGGPLVAVSGLPEAQTRCTHPASQWS
jgi:hypothetical protein